MGPWIAECNATFDSLAKNAPQWALEMLQDISHGLAELCIDEPWVECHYNSERAKCGNNATGDARPKMGSKFKGLACCENAVWY